MLQLILTVMAVSLTGALVAATLSYMPGWLLDYNKAKEISPKGFCRLERSTLDEITARGGFPMASVAQGETLDGVSYPYSDGGLAGYMGARYRYLPKGIEGAQWLYGRTNVAGQPTAYICLDGRATGFSEGAWRALVALRNQLPSGQMTIGANCGDVTDSGSPSGFPVGAAVTLFITPGFQATPSCS